MFTIITFTSVTFLATTLFESDAPILKFRFLLGFLVHDFICCSSRGPVSLSVVNLKSFLDFFFRLFLAKSERNLSTQPGPAVPTPLSLETGKIKAFFPSFLLFFLFAFLLSVADTRCSVSFRRSAG